MPADAGMRFPSRLLWMIGVMALIAGCASENLLVSDPESQRADAHPASAYGGLGGAKPAQASEPFNPFADNSTTTGGGRQVIAQPTIEEVMKSGTLPEMSFGRSDAPVTVIKYASLTCPYCRQFQRDVFPRLKRNYIDTGKVRFIIREFPIGRSSGNATIALRCAPPEKYLDLYSRFLDQQSAWVSQEVRLDAIHKVAAQVGLSRAEFDACLANQDMISGLNWVKNRGRTLGVIGTPNFFVQERLVKKVLSYDELTAMIDPLLGMAASGQRTSEAH